MIQTLKRSTDAIQIIPARGHLLIAQVDAPNRTQSGLYLSGGMTTMQMFGRIVRMGKPDLDAQGIECEVDYHAGEVVMIPRPSNPRTGEAYGNEPWMKAEGLDAVMVIPEGVIIARIDGYEDAAEEAKTDEHSVTE